MNQAQIELWVIEAQGGCEKAFEQLCRYYYPALLRFTYKICADEAMARDAVQNCWMKLANSLSKLQDPRAFKAWIYRSARWQTLDLLKRQSREIVEFTDKEVSAALTTNDHNESDSDKGSQLRELMNALSEIDQQAIHLFYLENMRLSEIAQVLCIPVGTVKSRLNRARNNLKKQLE
ncbi:RNA polymerase sigma factor [Thalassotalea fusca]